MSNETNIAVTEGSVGVMRNPPRLGETVIYVASPAYASNGSRVMPAIVTRIWSRSPDPLMNLTVFPDMGEPINHGSVGPYNPLIKDSVGWIRQSEFDGKIG